MKVIVFSGLPGTVKTKLADAICKHFGISVFAKDWLEANLLSNGLAPTITERPLGFASYGLMTTLAERQLMLGQSVILDSVANTETIRDAWRQISRQYGADWHVIECVCSDISLHRARLITRKRNIPGWHELTWSDVEKVKQYYAVWEDEHLILDMVNSFEENLSRAKAYCE